jgi:hypothetical protein
LKFFIGRNLHAYEYFVRMRFAPQMFRRCVEFSASLSAQRGKQRCRIASANLKHSEKNCFFVVPQAEREGSPRVKGIILGCA